jgi:hypothetical protein
LDESLEEWKLKETNMRKVLNALFIKNVKADPLQVTDFSDMEIDSFGQARKGFIFRVSPRGLKTFVARLKRPDGGYSEKKLGTYPAMQLGEARTLFDQHRHFGPPEVKMDTNALCDRYLEEWAKPHKRTWVEDERLLANEIRPVVGTKPIDEITRKDIREILNTMRDRGSPCSGNSLLAIVRKMLNWAVDQDLLEVNPIHRLKAFSVRHHSSFLNEGQLRSFLTQLPTADLPQELKEMFLLQLQTVVRVSEARACRWEEIDFKEKVWTIPVERSKTGVAHRILLSRQSIQLLEAREGNGSDFVFPQRA